MRTLVAIVAAALIGVGAAPAEAAHRGPQTIRLGSATLHKCKGMAGYCGSIRRALDPGRPNGAHLQIGFRWRPATKHDSGAPAIVAVEGGPGYPSIGSRSEYQGTYGPLLKTRNLLLVDNRGTGSSALIDCEPLQTYTGITSAPNFPALVADCARRIQSRYPKTPGAADLFATSYAAADMSAVLKHLKLGRVDLYGDSYGTWFTQSFISRYPKQLHSVILDSAYPIRNLDPWYASSGPAARNAMDAVCDRDLSCSALAPGSATDRFAQLVDIVRENPIEGQTRDSDGSEKTIRVDIRALVDLMQDSGTDPVIDREIDASVRAALAGDDVPILRLVQQSQTWSHGTSTADYFSDGLFFAVSCTDYPQLFDMAASPGERRSQFAAAAAMAPDAFYPFTPYEWLTLSAYSESYQACLDWPKPKHHAPPVPAKATPLPASIPLLVIGGDLDSLTPLSDAREFGPTLGRNVRVIPLPNTVHVTSEGDDFLFGGAACARSIIRRFVQAPDKLQSLDARCAPGIPAVHTPGAYPRSIAGIPPATVLSGNDPGENARRAVALGAQALTDTSFRWYYSSARTGPGLRGGNFTASPAQEGVRFNLHGVKFVDDATVDGSGTWQIGAPGRYHGDLVVHQPGHADVTVRIDWDQKHQTALATVGDAALVLPAP